MKWKNRRKSKNVVDVRGKESTYKSRIKPLNVDIFEVGKRNFPSVFDLPTKGDRLKKKK